MPPKKTVQVKQEDRKPTKAEKAKLRAPISSTPTTRNSGTSQPGRRKAPAKKTPAGNERYSNLREFLDDDDDEDISVLLAKSRERKRAGETLMAAPPKKEKKKSAPAVPAKRAPQESAGNASGELSEGGNESPSGIPMIVNPIVASQENGSAPTSAAVDDPNKELASPAESSHSSRSSELGTAYDPLERDAIVSRPVEVTDQVVYEQETQMVDEDKEESRSRAGAESSDDDNFDLTEDSMEMRSKKAKKAAVTPSEQEYEEDAMDEMFQSVRANRASDEDALMEMSVFDEDEEEDGVEDEEDGEEEEERAVENEEEEQSDEDEEEEVDDEDDGDKETRAMTKVAKRKGKAVSKISKNNASGVRDRGKAVRACLDALDQEITAVRRSKTEVYAIPLPLLVIEDDVEVQPAVVEDISLAVRIAAINTEGETLIAWEDNGRYVVEDGKHRLRGVLDAIVQSNIRRAANNRPLLNKRDIKLRVLVVEGGRLNARMKKLVAHSHAISSVFSKVVLTRYIMDELKMIDNPLLSMQLRQKIYNEKIKPKRVGEAGTPLYQIHTACLPENEFAFFAKNITNTAVNGCKLLKLYNNARSVNPIKAKEILDVLDQQDDIQTVGFEFERLKSMATSVGMLLLYKGYDERTAERIVGRIYSCTPTFNTVKRLTAYHNRLSRIVNMEKFMLGLERCFPPVAFTRAFLTVVANINKADSTLYILDEEAFLDRDTLSGIVALTTLRDPRPMNFIVTTTSGRLIIETINDALSARRAAMATTLTSSSRRTSSSSNIANDAVNNAPPFHCAAADVAIQCAPYAKQPGGARVICTAVPSCCFLRLENGYFLEEDPLMAFLTKMHMGGSVGPTCLRLLSFDATLTVRNNTFNTVYVQGTSPEPFAIAARCAANRVSIHKDIPANLKKDFVTTQRMLKGEWPDKHLYDQMYTPDATIREVPGTKGTKRVRKNKLREAISSGMLSN